MLIDSARSAIHGSVLLRKVDSQNLNLHVDVKIIDLHFQDIDTPLE